MRQRVAEERSWAGRDEDPQIDHPPVGKMLLVRCSTPQAAHTPVENVLFLHSNCSYLKKRTFLRFRIRKNVRAHELEALTTQ